MSKNLTIKDLTKQELLELIHYRGFMFSISNRDIAGIRWNTLTRKGQKLMDEACKEMKKYHGPENYSKYKKLMDKFDRSMAIIDEAKKLITSKSSRPRNEGG